MPTFVFSYRVPKGSVPGGTDNMAAWTAWFDRIGESVSDHGNPIFESTELGNCGADTQLGGYTFVTAPDLESAAALAKGSPVLESGGGVEVGAVTVLDMDAASGVKN